MGPIYCEASTILTGLETLVLLVCAYLWLQRFYARWLTLLIFMGFIIFETLEMMFGALLFGSGMFFAGAAPAIIILGAWLIARTYQESLRAAAFGGGAILLALIALAFRSIDLSLCSALPIGTHFLWHIFLSLAALLAIITLIIIDSARLTAARSKLRMDVHA
ncbi:MAG: hypothetical protein Q7R54_00805 [bacterium]|nr:hypothetical protein [bacterium]